jgi:hypothetical protein
VAGISGYCASKAALASLTRGLARALAPDVTVNGIAPGVVEWPEDYPQEEREKYLKRVPLSRAGTPEDVANLVHFLATDGSYITGQIIPLDGGRSITIRFIYVLLIILPPCPGKPFASPAARPPRSTPSSARTAWKNLLADARDTVWREYPAEGRTLAAARKQLEFVFERNMAVWSVDQEALAGRLLRESSSHARGWLHPPGVRHHLDDDAPHRRSRIQRHDQNRPRDLQSPPRILAGRRRHLTKAEPRKKKKPAPAKKKKSAKKVSKK